MNWPASTTVGSPLGRSTSTSTRCSRHSLASAPFPPCCFSKAAPCKSRWWAPKARPNSNRVSTRPWLKGRSFAFVLAERGAPRSLGAMSLMVFPGQLTARSEFYHQLAQMTAAGLGLMRALEQQRTRPPMRSYRRHLEEILSDLANGCTFADALRRQGSWLPEFDIALVEAG